MRLEHLADPSVERGVEQDYARGLPLAEAMRPEALLVWAMNGAPLTMLREEDDQIPVVARMRVEERAALSDIRNLYVYSSSGAQKVPLEAISSIALVVSPDVLAICCEAAETVPAEVETSPIAAPSFSRIAL